MHFRILKMIATSGFLTALECTKFVFGRGYAPDADGEANSARPDPIAGLTGLTYRGKGRGMGGKGEEGDAPNENSWILPEYPCKITKSECAAVMICDSLVNTHTHTHSESEKERLAFDIR